MPKGFTAIREAGKKIDESSNFEEFYSYLRFKLPSDGDEAIVRFLEQGEEVYSFWYHDFTNTDPSQGWKTKIPCLDQEDDGTPCPGCREDLKRRFRGLINVIWREAPVFKRDQEGNLVKDEHTKAVIVVGHKDQVAVWDGGKELFSDTLAPKDVAFKGLSSR